MARKAGAASAFFDIATIHQAEVQWWWTDEARHDSDYGLKVEDSVSAKVKELTEKYDVFDDTRFCCQWEGRRLCGESRENVEAAANELARHLARFKRVKPLSYFMDGGK
jgi:hypothetical protein